MAIALSRRLSRRFRVVPTATRVAASFRLAISLRAVRDMNHGQQSGEAKHEDDAVLTEFLGSLMDYTPTVKFQPFRLSND